MEAERLRREAEERDRAATAARSEQEQKLSHADAVDPDVRTDRHGNRVDDGATAPSHDAPRIDGITGEERRPEDRQA